MRNSFSSWEKRYLKKAAVVGAGAIVLMAIGALFHYRIFMGVGFIAILGFLGWMGLFLTKLLHESRIYQDRTYQSIDALMSLVPLVKPRLPLPSTRGWAASPDLLQLIVTEIKTREPEVIVELGSGVSSVYSGYILEQQGKGKLYAVDHEAPFLAQTAQRITTHALDAYVQPTLAPLAPLDVQGKTWQWYDTTPLKEIPFVDMIVVDGPPRRLQALSRYPALPVFYDRLRSGGCIIVDDYRRADDKATVKRWMSEYPDLTLEEYYTEKGAAILRKG